MGAKRDTGEFVADWIAREKARAETCRSQAAELERQALRSDRRAEALAHMLEASGYLNEPSADDEAGF